MRTTFDIIAEELLPEDRRVAKAACIKLDAWLHVEEADYITPLMVANLIKDLESGKIKFQGRKFGKLRGPHRKPKAEAGAKG